MADAKKTNTQGGGTSAKVKDAATAKAAQAQAAEETAAQGSPAAGQGNSGSQPPEGAAAAPMAAVQENGATRQAGDSASGEVTADASGGDTVAGKDAAKPASGKGDKAAATTPAQEKKAGKAIDRIAGDLFAKNGNLSKVYFTSDAVPFATEGDALKHAATLLDKTIYPKTKELS